MEDNLILEFKAGVVVSDVREAFRKYYGCRLIIFSDTFMGTVADELASILDLCSQVGEYICTPKLTVRAFVLDMAKLFGLIVMITDEGDLMALNVEGLLCEVKNQYKLLGLD